MKLACDIPVWWKKPTKLNKHYSRFPAATIVTIGQMTNLKGSGAMWKSIQSLSNAMRSHLKSAPKMIKFTNIHPKWLKGHFPHCAHCDPIRGEWQVWDKSVTGLFLSSDRCEISVFRAVPRSVGSARSVRSLPLSTSSAELGARVLAGACAQKTSGTLFSWRFHGAEPSTSCYIQTAYT